MGYRCDIHTHCRENSPCASASGWELAQAYRNAGFDGIVVANHFLNGSATRLGVKEWEREIDHFFAGYESAKAYGDQNGLDVWFGWEYNYEGADLLTYGLGRDWLKAHPDMCSWDIVRYCGEVHEAGGFITHAHPFREAPFVSQRIQLFPRLVDAVEVYNGSHEASCFGPDRLNFNKWAQWYADAYHLLPLAGSDTHDVVGTGRESRPFRSGGVVFQRRFESETEMIAIIRAGEYENECPELGFEELKRL